MSENGVTGSIIAARIMAATVFSPIHAVFKY
jgi:hypothetical protein